MKAIVYNKRELPHKLVYRELEQPMPNDNEVMVKIRAVSLNAADYRSLRMGMIPKKGIFGADIAGTVELTGKNIRGYKPGDEVIGDLSGYGFGGLAEYAVAPEKFLAPKPAGLTFEEAAALPLAAVTALQALRNKGKAGPGRRVLVIGSGGGVGSYAVQLGKYFGAHVTAVCSARNMDLSRELGADRVIDYQKENFLKSGNLYDLVLAINGNYPLTTCLGALSKNGIYVMVGGALPQIFKALAFGWLLSAGNKKVRFLAAKPNAEDLRLIASLAGQGSIRPVLVKQYPLHEASVAMQYLAAGHATGKVVVTV